MFVAITSEQVAMVDYNFFVEELDVTKNKPNFFLRRFLFQKWGYSKVFLFFVRKFQGLSWLQETLWMMAVDISLSQEPESVQICQCVGSDTEQSTSSNSKFTLTELLVLEYCKDKSIRNSNTFIQQCIQYRSGKPVPLSYRFFCFLVMQETKISRQKLKLFSQFKNADRELWKRRSDYSRERRAESRSLSLDYFNPRMEELMWCERVDIQELVMPF